jgi:uncharacterized membrane protein (DUF373 family)
MAQDTSGKPIGPGERIIGWMDWAIVAVEGVVAAILVVMAVWGAVGLAMATFGAISAQKPLAVVFVELVDVALLVFILVELFRIAIAYMRHENVIPTVMEAALVAVARKFVIFDTHAAPMDMMLKAFALAALLLAVSISWFLMAKRMPALVREGGE